MLQGELASLREEVNAAKQDTARARADEATTRAGIKEEVAKGKQMGLEIEMLKEKLHRFETERKMTREETEGHGRHRELENLRSQLEVLNL